MRWNGRCSNQLSTGWTYYGYALFDLSLVGFTTALSTYKQATAIPIVGPQNFMRHRGMFCQRIQQ